MLTFTPETGLTASTTAEIRAEVAAMFVSAFTKDGLPALDTTASTPAGQLIDSITAIIADKDAELLYLANQFNPKTAEGVWQAALGQIYFLTPHTATARTATCTCTGLSGTQIAAGSLVQCSEDNTQWAATETVVIPSSGQADVSFQCTTMETGSVGSGTLTQIVTVTPGWDSVTNSTASTAGSEAESQLAFETRRFNSVAINARGSVAALYAAIASLDDVVDCVVLENPANAAATQKNVSIPAHSVWITVEGGETSAIAEAIYKNKDAGCGTSGGTSVTYTDTTMPSAPTFTYQICRPTAVEIGVLVEIDLTDTTPGNIQELIQSAVVANFNGETSGLLRCGAAQTIYSSRFVDDIRNAGADGLKTVTLMKGYVEGQAGTWLNNIVLDADEFPVLSSGNVILVTNT